MKDRERVRALETRLARVWSESEEPHLDSRWSASVMQSIRAAEARRHTVDQIPLERLFRNAFLAAAAVAVATLAIVAVRTSSLDPSLELARLLASDPQGLLQLICVL